MPLFSRVLAVVFCFFGLFASIGCEKKLTLDNYNKIQVGMTIDEVFTILGPGEKLDTGTAARVAQSYLGDITSAQDRQNRNQLKQGLGDLTGQIQKRDEQTQREAGVPVPQGNAPPPVKPQGPRGNSPVPDGPVRERFIWTEGKVEITIDFADNHVASKNQDGL